jgi:hypothetical protein
MKLKRTNRAGRKRVTNDKPGFIYFVRCRDRVKIGFTQNVRRRMGQLRSDIPYEAELIGVMLGSLSVERDTHARFARSRASGEWFHCTREILDFVKEYAVEYEQIVADAA